jgi:hypothetical protein
MAGTQTRQTCAEVITAAVQVGPEGIFSTGRGIDGHRDGSDLRRSGSAPGLGQDLSVAPLAFFPMAHPLTPPARRRHHGRDASPDQAVRTSRPTPTALRPSRWQAGRGGRIMNEMACSSACVPHRSAFYGGPAARNLVFADVSGGGDGQPQDMRLPLEVAPLLLSARALRKRSASSSVISARSPRPSPCPQ